MKIRALPFQVGDWVRSPRTSGRITAVGQNEVGQILYRLGRNQYWYGWQLRKVKHGNS